MDQATRTASTATPTEQITHPQADGTGYDRNTHSNGGHSATAPRPKKLDPYSSLGLRRQLYLESRAMAEYALAKGQPIPAKVITTIESYQAEFESR